MKGSTYKRCKCRDDNGHELGKNCPQLFRKDGSYNSRHGSWYFRFELDPGHGGRRSSMQRGGFESREAAQDAMNAARVKAGQGHDVASRMRFGTFFASWLQGKDNIQPTTFNAYESHGRNYLIPWLGHIELDRLRVDHVTAMFIGIECENERIRNALSSPDSAIRASVKGRRIVSAATKQRIRATLRSCLTSALKQQKVSVNVAALVELDQGRRPKGLVWTEERVREWQAGFAHARDAVQAKARGQQVEGFKLWLALERPSSVMVWTRQQTGAFLDSVSKHPLYAAFHVIALRGLRRGEACGLRWVDLDLDEGTLTVRKQRRQNGRTVEDADVKTEASESEVALDVETVDVLRAHRIRQNRERLAWGEAWQGEGHVFTREDGAPLHPGTLSYTFEKLAFKAGLPPIRLHDLRHGAASIALAGGVEMRTVQGMLRHSSMSITADTYTSVYRDVARSAAETVSGMVPRASRGESGTTAPPSLPQGSDNPPNGQSKPSQSAGQRGWGGWDLNPRLTDYEFHQKGDKP